MSPPDEINPRRSAAKELLLADYLKASESFWKNELTGETRVNWLIGIVTAAAGGLLALTGSEHRPHGTPLRLVFLAVLSALLAFGIITLLRIVKRNETTDGYKKDSETIRQMFKDYFDEDHILGQYNPFGGGEKKDLARKLGGLAHTVLTINSLLVAGIVAALGFPLPVPEMSNGGPHTLRLWLACIGALAAFVLTFWLQFELVKRRDKESKSRLRSTVAGLSPPM